MRIRVFTDVPHIKLAIGLATLQQIFLNLLQNAMDVIEANLTEDRWIEIFGSMDYETKRLRLGISHAGPKIDPLLARQIFERGFSTKGRRGSGLGVYPSHAVSPSVFMAIWNGMSMRNPTRLSSSFLWPRPAAELYAAPIRPHNNFVKSNIIVLKYLF